MIRSVLAVLAGIVVFVAALFVMEAAATALLAPPDAPTDWSAINQSATAMVLWLIWETGSMVSAGYVTAWIAARSQVLHATIVGALQMVMTVWAFVAVRGDGEPLWFWIVGIVMMVPAAWYGGRLRTIRALA